MSVDYYFKLHKKYPEFCLDTELEINNGEFFALLGPSGCGKTTLLRLIAGLEENMTGIIRIEGQEISTLPPAERRIGMVFQEYALFPHLSVVENIGYGLKARHLTKKELTPKIKGMLDLFELDTLQDRYIHQLSGGERQRVALARSLITEPRILLLDEPFSALDYSLRARLRRELRDYQKRLGFTTIFVTHQQEEALILSDRVGLMQQGHIWQVGTPEEIYQHPINRFAAEFLGETNFFPMEMIEKLKTGINHDKIKTNHGEHLINHQWSGQWMVRPENILINPFNNKLLTFTARVLRVDYLGYMYRLEAEAYQRQLIIYAHPANFQMSVGEMVILGISADSLQPIAN